MVSAKQKFTYLETGDIDLADWFARVEHHYHLTHLDTIKAAAELAKSTSKGLTTFYGQPCIEQGLEMAEIALSLKLDQTAIAAAILISTMRNTKLTPEHVTEKINADVTKLIRGVLQMDTLHQLQQSGTNARDQTQIDRFRKLLLAMVSDIRVVLIKLAERTCIMRGIKNINPDERKHIAQETMDVYAPLANRLGIGQVKWELEDIAFHYNDPITYKTIAKFLAERRVDREAHIHDIISRLKDKLTEAGIKADITGRAKHIYSIYLKAQRKSTEYQGIYDYSAIRLLVPTL
jgi:GTP pyrophosphokinase